MTEANESIWPAAAGAAGAPSVLKGLLWREWLARRWLVMLALSAWLIAGWVLMVFFHPAFVLAFGVLYALQAGASFGGGEAAEGSEEFALSLPPTRSQRYLLRLALGGGTVLVLTVGGTAAIALDAPQRLWGLVVESGFTEPFPACKYRFLYWLAVAAPLAVFAFGFALAAVARSAATAQAAGLAGLLSAGGVVGAGFLCECMLWRRLNGYVSVPALLAGSAAVLGLGHLAYQRKEGVARPAAMGGGRRWPWAIALAVAAVLIPAFLWLMHSSAPMPERRLVRPLTVERDAAERLERTIRAPTTVPTTGPVERQTAPEEE